MSNGLKNAKNAICAISAALMVVVSIPFTATAGTDRTARNIAAETGVTIDTTFNSQPGRRRWRKKSNRRGPYYGYRNYGQYRSAQNRRYRTVRRYYWRDGVRRYRYVRIYY